MDFNTILHGALPTFSANATEEAGNTTGKTFSSGVMESLVPLLGSQFSPLLKAYMLFHNMAGSRLGLDPAFIVAAFGVLWAGNKLWKQLYVSIVAFVHTYFMASITVSSGDEMYFHMMKWLASQPRMVNSRSLTAESTSKSAWDEEEDPDILSAPISADGTGVYLNFSNQEAKSPPRFIPAIGTHGFWHDGRYFSLHRKKEQLFDDGGGGGMQYKDKEYLMLSCFGRSPEPVKQLLQHAKEQYYSDHHANTTVKRPSPQNMRRYGGRHNWMQVSSRPVRPMRTVVLDEKQKIQVLSDMNEYLHPATPRWYANRGIPLRRGYLFYGPPGTGKTSLSFALAGVFGLDIYVISLLEPTLTEEDLSALFNSLPRRCVVLLEDIDTAGLARAPDKDDAENTTDSISDGKDGKIKSNKKSESKDDWKVSDLARELKKQGGENEKKGISLSGLLNAIDGVASHEGRVLIMTTNKPESLDEALIRPGRVDLQVGFSNATQEQAKELFERMYEADSKPPPRKAAAIRSSITTPTPTTTLGGALQKQQQQMADDNNNATKDSSVSGDDFSSEGSTIVVLDEVVSVPSSPAVTAKFETRDEGDQKEPTRQQLTQIAADFAAKIPTGKLISPAEIQGFLLKRKKAPRLALAEVEVWVDALIKQKASKVKVLQVQ
ncbi:BCS1 N terminal-domain-containing protein [Apodospora peruviana]|uniref:BCS1 N terminal-domain-containing protein n=1 Tax=Apodospora peruviana TaxID=516989 RepID=A0AAE0MAD6_9PEZI|nr:BCS1 N terminal-domain-containing protein [Apodospora peruviana]